MRLVLIIREDIKLFPPVVTVARSLLRLGHDVDVIGFYSDPGQKALLEREGVRFHTISHYDINGSRIQKLRGNLRFRREVTEIVASLDLEGCDYYLWIFQGLTIALLHKLVSRHPCILHPLEFVGMRLRREYRLITRGYDAVATYRNALKVVNCEYNRAQIMKGLFNLDRPPFILPNKMVVDDAGLLSPPEEVAEVVKEVEKKIAGRKAVLYQGIFLQDERRLDEFCDAVSLLGKDYVMLLMGSDSQPGYRELKAKYAGSGSVVFVPFIAPPFHLLVTRLAKVGVLTYFPRPYDIARVINPLYCAPNKIFEYGRFGIPMIGNDIPGLHYIFKDFHCGLTVGYPMSAEMIREALERVFADYDAFSRGSLAYYESVDVDALISDILS